ncbi:conserved repeat domain-containing protein [Acinetobacter marinus]|uniref:Conserved repeat domain-containing protein n=1 Tax=Acinetobacter marinus TaxID=281375 RepID=A0A1G6H1Z1_9GAMM|nr:hypothetical protein [Acinetobacter marinus]SDB88174.1 conserved repeat domain-containing protein [Acinetobacter marinus]
MIDRGQVGIFYKQIWQKSFALIILGCALMMVQQFAFAQPKAGTKITNIASGDFLDAQGNLQVINSNPVVLSVQPIYALTLQSNQSNIGTIGSQLDFPHVLTNTGNIADNYQLSLTQSTADQFDLNGVAVYIDRDQNGIPDDNNNLLASGATIRLDAEESAMLVVVGTIPSDRTAGNIANFNLTATSQANSTLNATVTDSTKVIDDAAIHVTKSQSLSYGKTGTILTYTFTYENTGTAAGRLVLTDTLPADLSYQKSSGKWSNGSGNLTDADDTETGTNAAIIYQASESTGVVAFELASIPALTRGTVSFAVQIDDDAKAKIPNTANYQVFDSANTVQKATTTNTVIFTVQHELAVVLNNKSSAPDDGGDATNAPDNLISVDSAKAGGAEVVFDNYVWNTGQSTDTYNLTINKDNVPECAVVRLYHADGRTLLTDSNADGIIDTGAIASSANKPIKLGVYFPSDCVLTGTMNFDITATSVTNTAISNSTRDQIVDVVITGESDLYNAEDKSGEGVGEVSDNGVAWISKSGSRGSTVVFPLEIKNSGSLSNNYELFASSAEIDLSNITTTLPDGWTVNFYEGDATCSTLGGLITNSGNIAAGATKQYCAVVSIPENTDVSTTPIWFAMKSPLNAQGDSVKDQVVVQQYRNLSLVNDQQGQVAVGGTITYLHTLRNNGVLVEGDQAGEILLAVTPHDPADGFNYTLYYDANANGVIDATDPLATDLNAIVSAGLQPNESIQLLLKVQAPSTAAVGLISNADITVTATDTIQGLTLDPIINTDQTSVGVSQLRLIKEQAKDEDCTWTAANVVSATYTVTPQQIKPNQCLNYRLTIRNDSETTATSVKINDVVPAYTILRASLPPSVSQGTVTVTGVNIEGAMGDLAPLEQAILYFSIRVTP